MSIEEGASPTTVKQVGLFLFSKPKTGIVEDKFLIMRSDISSKGVFKSVLHYQIFYRLFGCDEANKICSIILESSIGRKRKGRLEAVQTLQSNLPPQDEPLTTGKEGF